MNRRLLLVLPLCACNKLECPEYSGLHDAGDEWDWQHTAAWTEANGGTTGTWTIMLDALDLDEAGDVIEVVVTAVGIDNTPDTATTHWSTDVRLQCDAGGLWLKSAGWTGEIASPVGTFPVALLKELTSYDLVMLPEMEVGTTWAADVEGTTTDPQNGEQPYAETITRTVTASSVVVPAGSYDALTVTGDGTDGLVTTSRIVSGLGTVSDDVGELVAYRPIAPD